MLELVRPSHLFSFSASFSFSGVMTKSLMESFFSLLSRLLSFVLVGSDFGLRGVGDRVVVCLLFL